MKRKPKIRTGVMVRLLIDHPAYLHRIGDVEPPGGGNLTVPAGTEVMVLESFREYGFNTLNEAVLDVRRGDDETFRIITKAPSKTLRIIPTPKGAELVDSWISASGDRYYRTVLDIEASRAAGSYVIPAGSILEVNIVRRTRQGVTLHATVVHPTSLSSEEQYPRPLTRDTWEGRLVTVGRCGRR